MHIRGNALRKGANRRALPIPPPSHSSVIISAWCRASGLSTQKFVSFYEPDDHARVTR